MFLRKCTIFILVIFFTSGVNTKSSCPSICVCDRKNLIMQLCPSRSLKHLDIEITRHVQYLDLSYNSFNVLHSNMFNKGNKFSRLQYLNFSDNSIDFIEEDAFKGLNELYSLDLSYNGIFSIDQNVFDSLSKLYELFLTGNGLMDLENLKSTSLKVLYIGNNDIDSLSPDSFKGFPNLNYLDLSENNLKTMSPDFLKPLAHLGWIDITFNLFDCDEQFKAFKEYKKRSLVKYMDSCLDSLDSEDSDIIEFPKNLSEKVHNLEVIVQKNSVLVATLAIGLFLLLVYLVTLLFFVNQACRKNNYNLVNLNSHSKERNNVRNSTASHLPLIEHI